MKPVIIIGAGGHARVLHEVLFLKGTAILGHTDIKEKSEAQEGTITFLGDDNIIDGFSPDDVNLVNGLGSVSLPIHRNDVYTRWRKKGYHFAAVVHPSAIISPGCKIGEGVQIMAGAIIQTGSTLGDNVLVNTGAQIDHDNTIGSHCHIAPGAVLSGDICVEECCHLGVGCNVLQGVVIGARSVIGAGSVVLQDVSAGSIMVGIPARRINNI